MNYDIKNAFKALADIEDIDIEDLSKDKKLNRPSVADGLKPKILKEAVSKLEPKFDHRKSFYGKAKVDVKDDGTKVLWSYNTPVCRIKDGKVTLLRRGYLGWSSSPTTLRHVKDFLQQNGFEAGSYKDIAKRYPEEQAGVNEGLVEEWKGPQVLSPDSKEYKNLQLACDILNKDSVHGIEYKLETTYFDYGQKWEYTAIIAHDPKGNIWGGTWQVGSPRNWEEIVNADSEEEVKAAVDDLKKDEYFKDVANDFPKHAPMKSYNLNDLEHVEDWNDWAIYKVDGKYSTNPNTTRKRFDTIDGLKAFLKKRYNIKEEKVDDDEKLAFEWFSNELNSNHDLWDEEGHAYDLDKVNELIDSQEEWDKDMLRWFFKEMGELDDNDYDYDSFVVLCGHYPKNEALKEELDSEDKETKKEYFNVMNDKDIKKAKEILNTEDTDDTEKIIDVDADSIEELKKSYAGQIILQCNKCFTPRFISVDELQKSEDKDEDGNTIYNEEDICPQCGEKLGYIVAGQVSKFDSEKAQEEEQEEESSLNQETEVEDETKPEETDFDLEIEEESFNKLVSNYLKETYSNVETFKLTSGIVNGKDIIFEGIISFTSGKSKATKFVFEGKKQDNKLILEGYNTTFTNDKGFVVEAFVENRQIKFETLSYKYNQEDVLVEGIIKN